MDTKDEQYKKLVLWKDYKIGKYLIGLINKRNKAKIVNIKNNREISSLYKLYRY